MFCEVQERQILPGDNGVAASPRVAPAALLPVAPGCPGLFQCYFPIEREICALVHPKRVQRVQLALQAGRAIPFFSGTAWGSSSLSSVRRDVSLAPASDLGNRQAPGAWEGGLHLGASLASQTALVVAQ